MGLMNGFKTKKLWLIPLLVLSGCAVSDVRKVSSGNPELELGVIGETDGCKIYRFRDNGYSHYFVKCNKETPIQTMQYIGGKFPHPDTVPTL